MKIKNVEITSVVRHSAGTYVQIPHAYVTVQTAGFFGKTFMLEVFAESDGGHGWFYVSDARPVEREIDRGIRDAWLAFKRMELYQSAKKGTVAK